MISFIAYLAHQNTVSNLPSNSTVLKELSLTPRNRSSSQISADIVSMFYDKSVPAWARVLDTSDFPHDYFIVFGAFLSTVLALILPWSLCQFVMTELATHLVKKEEADFLINHYLPELHDGIKDLQVPLAHRLTILRQTIGTLAKVFYAFLYQEHYLSISIMQTSLAIEIGGKLMPWANGLSAKISGFPQTDESVNTSTNVYPGEAFCKETQGHSIWHEESANGLLELVFLSDYIGRVTKEIT